MPGTQSGKVAIVTGGSANIGRLFVSALAADGASVVIHYNSARRAGEAGEVLNLVKAQGAEGITHQGDLTSAAEIAWLSGMTITGELGDPRDIVPVSGSWRHRRLAG
jgi:NAD(P)-dependent dehydrogenase (short-subunit alcohol dehydrogenase family)